MLAALAANMGYAAFGRGPLFFKTSFGALVPLYLIAPRGHTSVIGLPMGTPMGALCQRGAS